MAGLMRALSNFFKLLFVRGIEECAHVGRGFLGYWFAVPFEYRFVEEVGMLDDLDTIGNVDSIGNFFRSAV